MTTGNQSKGFALLIKAPSAVRRFVPLEGETITILDKQGRKIWSLKLPIPIDNPGVTLHEVQIDLLTEREFGNFCEKTWNRGAPDHTATPAPTPSSP